MTSDMPVKTIQMMWIVKPCLSKFRLTQMVDQIWIKKKTKKHTFSFKFNIWVSLVLPLVMFIIDDFGYSFKNTKNCLSNYCDSISSAN